MPILLPGNDEKPARWQDPALLDRLTRVRAPWDRLTRRIVRAAVSRFVPPSARPVVEVGAGGGQLRDWLPPAVAADTTHTDTSEPFLAVLRRRYPGAKALIGDVAALPFEGGSVGAVLGLCVLDTVAELAAVRDEVRRVLTPGGVVMHVLDLATSPWCLFPALVAGGEIPLPNFAADPAFVASLDAASRAALPATDEFDEVLAVGWPQYSTFVGMLVAAGHPVVKEIGPYATLAEPGHLDPDRLAQEFMAARSDPKRLCVLNRGLVRLTLAARGFGREWPLRPISLRAHLRGRLSDAFGPGHGFAVEFAGPVSAWEEARLPRGVQLKLRHGGTSLTRSTLTPVPGTPVEVLEGTTLPPIPDRPTAATTVEVFVARRTEVTRLR